MSFGRPEEKTVGTTFMMRCVDNSNTTRRVILNGGARELGRKKRQMQIF